MALVDDDAAAYLSQLPPERQKYRYPMNGLPEIRTDIKPEPNVIHRPPFKSEQTSDPQL